MNKANINNDAELGEATPSPPSSPSKMGNGQFVGSRKVRSPDNSPGAQTAGTDMSSPTALTINQSYSNDTPRGNRTVAPLILGMKAPILCIVALLLLGSIGGGLWGWLQIPGLKSQVKELETQVDRLEQEVDRLEQEIDRLESQVDRLELQNNRYEQLNGELNGTVAELQQTNQELKSTAAQLETTVTDLKDENNRYSVLNRELRTILSFLNETSMGVNETFETIVEYLDDQIAASRVLTLNTLENTYIQRTMNWDCSYRDIFRGEPFVENENANIANSLPLVLEYVEEQVLSELCLDADEFETFLDSRYSLDSLSTNQLYQGVAVYVSAAMNYYFPDAGETGVTTGDWAEAGYRCENVTSFRFVA